MSREVSHGPKWLDHTLAALSHEINVRLSYQWADPDKLTVLMSPKLYTALLAYYAQCSMRTVSSEDYTFHGLPIELITSKQGYWYGLAEIWRAEGGSNE
jgi:hypothetical protein